MKILPVFIPQGGCSRRCLFCNQLELTGVTSPPQLRELDKLVEKYRETAGKFEIAFYGGTFTALDEPDQQRYFEWAFQYIRNGLCTGIRISTRPDELDEARTEFLKRHGVTFVELGVQSFDDEVLFASHRGYTHEDVLRAASILRRNQLDFGIHLMVGLPRDNPQKSLLSAMETADLGAKTCRIHPTIVLKNTELEKLYLTGSYHPLTLWEALDICSDMLAVFLHRNVRVIRMGLFIPESQKTFIVAGPYHPRFGELVKIHLLRKLAEYVGSEVIVWKGTKLPVREIRSAQFFNDVFCFSTSEGLISHLDALKEYVGGVLSCSKIS